ncbi:MAG: methyltransferase domain-containing protein [Bacteroidota bacterium]
MAVNRKPLQGLKNVVQFNWHFYLLSGLSIAGLVLLSTYLEGVFQSLLLMITVCIASSTMISLIATVYIYDLSSLYEFRWLSSHKVADRAKILNINAGFDETSTLLSHRYPNATLLIADFYDPTFHTEVSIKRARKAYPPHPDTFSVKTDALPYENDEFDMIFVTFAAHEVRDPEERLAFFRELLRVVKPQARIFVTEHLRDLRNFLVYTIGFMHFYSRSSWLQLFRDANLELIQEVKTTPFVSTFILSKYGNSD